MRVNPPGTGEHPCVFQEVPTYEEWLRKSLDEIYNVPSLSEIMSHAGEPITIAHQQKPAIVYKCVICDRDMYRKLIQALSERYAIRSAAWDPNIYLVKIDVMSSSNSGLAFVDSNANVRPFNYELLEDFCKLSHSPSIPWEVHYIEYR